MSKQKESNIKQNKVIWLALAVVCVIVAVVAIIMFTKDKSAEKQADSQYSSLASQVNQEEPVEEESQPEEKVEYTLEEKIARLEEKYGMEIPRKNIDFADLQANVNPDIYAWIYIPGTNVDYPILQHPTDDGF